MNKSVCSLIVLVLICASMIGCSYDSARAKGEGARRAEISPFHAVLDASKPPEEPRDAGPPSCPDAGEPPPPVARCWITGGGQVDGETLGGNAKPFLDGTVDGEWNHVDHEGNHFHGDPDTIVLCDFVGPPDASPPSVEFNRIIFEGTGTWTELGGDSIPVTFQVIVIDHGEPGREDVYTLMVFSGTTLIHSISGTLDRGNLQIHPSNPGHP